MSDPPWYVTFFDEEYLRQYAEVFDEDEDERQTDAIVERAGLPPGARVLDLACGQGRHAIPLARRGFRVTGLDLSEALLERARREAARRGAEVSWVRADMREIPFEDAFDAVVNIFTAFGYLEDEEEDLRVLGAVARALRPGGVFVLETLYRDGLFRRFRPHHVEKSPDGLLVLHEHTFDDATSRIDDEVTRIEPDGRRTSRRTSVRLYTVREFDRMLTEAGLRLEAWYGGLDGAPLTLESRRLVLVARKP